MREPISSRQFPNDQVFLLLLLLLFDEAICNRDQRPRRRLEARLFPDVQVEERPARASIQACSYSILINSVVLWNK